jgi:hypothetical protein
MISAPVLLLDAIRWASIILTLPLLVYLLYALWRARSMMTRFFYGSFALFVVIGCMDRFDYLGKDVVNYRLPLYILAIGAGLLGVWGFAVEWWLDRRPSTPLEREQ